MRSWWSKVTRRVAILRYLRNVDEASLVFQTLAFAAVVPVLLRLPLYRLHVLLEPQQGSPSHDPERLSMIVSVVDAVLRAGKPLLRSSCLTRGLTLYYFLRRAGLEVTLCFGVETSGDTIVGHCWLVKDGEPFLEAQDPRSRFITMYSFSAGRCS